jgi:hypothetical protein
MINEFVLFKESFDLKELGFNEECIGYYEHPLGLLLADSVFYTNSELQNITAPTYSQSFEFFREKHNLQSHIKIASTLSILSYDFVIENKSTIISNNISYRTNRGAEIGCLKKLIEIVKNK